MFLFLRNPLWFDQRFSNSREQVFIASEGREISFFSMGGFAKSIGEALGLTIFVLGWSIITSR